jgi:hypothetical protein
VLAKSQVNVFFSAHGVPKSYVEEAGDPYKEEMEECVALIMDELKRRGRCVDSQCDVVSAGMGRAAASFLALSAFPAIAVVQCTQCQQTARAQ